MYGFYYHNMYMYLLLVILMNGNTKSSLCTFLCVDIVWLGIPASEFPTSKLLGIMYS